MSKRRGNKRRGGRRDVGAIDPRYAPLGDLLALIRHVNPTDRELSAEEASRRYARKSELQSVLIRRFADQLEALPDPDDGAVLLRHRGSKKSAGHAVVDQLEEQARRWVRAQLDARIVEMLADPVNDGPEETAPARGAATDDSAPSVEVMKADDGSRGAAPVALAEQEGLPTATSELLVLGRDAMDAYDYERARRCFAAALVRPQGHQAALPLLELLVDYLADYADAHALGSALPPALRRDAQVRLFLAIAASQLADRDAALAYVSGCDDPRAAEVYLSLAKAALTAGDAKAAAELVQQARARVVFDPRVEELGTAIEAHLNEQRRPAEEALSACLSAGDEDAAEREAHALLARWPGSRVARKVLAQLAKGRRAREVAAIAQRADHAVAAGDLSRAATLCRKGLELDPEHAALTKTLERIEGALLRDEERRRVADVVASLQGEDREHALRAYLELPAGLRERARQQHDLAPLFWLEQMDATRSAARRQRAVRAVGALAQAQAALSEAPARAVELLDAHNKMLSGVPEAQALLAEARSLAIEQAEEAAERAIARLEEALTSGKLDHAREELAATGQADMTSSQRQRARALERRLRQLESDEALLRRYDEGLRSKDLIAARRCLDALITRANTSDERERYEGMLAGLREQIAVEWRVQRVVGGEELGRLELDDAITADNALVWVTPDLQSVVLVQGWAGWVFIRRIDLASGELTEGIFIQPKEPLGSYLGATVDGRALWIEGKGRLLELDLDSADIRACTPLTPLIPATEVLEFAAVVPDSHYLWLTASRRDPYEETTRIYDLQAGRVHRELPTGLHPRYVPGPERRIVSSIGGEFAVYDGRGAAIKPEHALPSGYVARVVAHPSGRGLVIAPDDEEVEGPFSLEFMVPGASGRVDISGGAEALRSRALATARDCGMTFVVLEDEGGANELVGLRSAGESGQLEIAYRVPAPALTALATDCDARVAVALCAKDRGILAVTLGPHAPTLPHLDREQEAALGSRLPPFESTYGCEGDVAELKARTLSFIGVLDDVSPPALPAWLHTFRDGQGHDAENVLALVHALERRRYDKEAKALGRWLWERHPEEPLVRVHHASKLVEAEASDWPLISELLHGVDASRLGSQARHCCHLRGLALLQVGRPVEAIAAWREGSAHEGLCQLDVLIDYAGFFGEAQVSAAMSKSAPATAPASLARQLVRAIQAADRALAKGFPDLAIEHLERRGLREADEIQSTSRLAAAYLQWQAATPAAAYRKAAALAKFCALTPRAERLMRRSLPLADATWDQARLDALCAEARAWLASCVLDVKPSGQKDSSS